MWLGFKLVPDTCNWTNANGDDAGIVRSRVGIDLLKGGQGVRPVAHDPIEKALVLGPELVDFGAQPIDFRHLFTDDILKLSDMVSG